MYGAKADGLGLRMFDEGKEMAVEDVKADPKSGQTIPLVWLNPVTGERALEVHAIIAYQIHYRESPDDEFKIIDDLATVRQMLDDIQRPFITPENVLFAPTDEGGVSRLLFIARSLADVSSPLCRHALLQQPTSPSLGCRVPRLSWQPSPPPTATRRFRPSLRPFADRGLALPRAEDGCRCLEEGRLLLMYIIQ